jgi:serine/threonine-protein kinase 24/25/MST4
VNRVNVSPKEEQDEWIFDTVKPGTIITPARPTSRRRKVSRIPSGGPDACVPLMQRMDLNSAPLGNVTDSPAAEGTCRIYSRKSSTATVLRAPSGSTPTARRVSNRPPPAKQPLGVDLSFGNSPSTVRHFKRISSGERRAALSSHPPDKSFHPNPQAPTFRPSPPNSNHPLDINNENTPPSSQAPPVPVTKDALYGRRAYGKVLDGVFQEAYAQSGSQVQRAAMASVAQAWAHLDEIDPQGEFLLLKAMIDRLQGDSKLASALGIAVAPTPIKTPPSPVKLETQTSQASLSGTTVNGTTRIRSSTTSTPASSCTKVPSSEAASTPASTPMATPGATPDGTVVKSPSPLKGPKLVLAQNNPHLKSHRRRQSALVGGEKDLGYGFGAGIDEKKLPGHVERGMEHQGLLADVLYGRWLEGLKGRWQMT